MAVNVLDSFFIALGFQVDTEDIEKFHKKANELRDSALRLGAIFTGAAVGIGLMVQKAAEGMGELAHFAELNNLTAKEVAAWNKVAAENEISNEAAMSSLQSLNQKIGEAALGLGRGRMVFQRLGMSARDSAGHVKSVDTVLGEISDKMHGMSRQQQIAMAQKLGLDPKFVLLLEKGSANLAKVRAEAEAMGAFGEEDYKKAEEINKAFIKARMTLGIFTKMLAVQFFPIVKKSLDKYLEWFKEFRKSEQVTRAFRIIAVVVGKATDYFVRLLTATKDVVSYLARFRVVLWAVTGIVGILVAYKVGAFFSTLATAVMDAAKAMASFSAASALPLILTGGLVLAIGLLIDELYNYYQGNETIIGQLQSRFAGAIYAAWAVLLLLIGGFIALKWAAISSMMETMAIVAMYAAEWIAAHAAMAVATLAAYWPVLLVIAALALVIAAVWLVWKNWDKITAWMSKAWDWLVGKLKAGLDWFIDKLTKVGEMEVNLIKKLPGGERVLRWIAEKVGPESTTNGPATSGGVSPTAAGGVLGRSGNSPAPVQQHTTAVTGNQITVISPDPGRAGQDVHQELNRMNRNATRNGQSGVTL